MPVKTYKVNLMDVGETTFSCVTEMVLKSDYDKLQGEGMSKALTALENDNPTVQAITSVLNKIYDLKSYILDKPSKADEIFHIIESFSELDKDKLYKYVEKREKAASAYHALQKICESTDLLKTVQNFQETLVKQQVAIRDLKLKNQDYCVKLQETEKKLQGYETAEWIRKDPKALYLFQLLQQMTEPQKQYIYKFCDNLIQMKKDYDQLMKG
jgi:hypothetical protein